MGYDGSSTTKGNLQNKMYLILPEVELHNEKVDNVIEYLNSNKQTFGIIDKGRTNDECSCIWVEKDTFTEWVIFYAMKP